MAKGNMFLGMSRGSVGDVTFYRNQGQQCARARNRAPKNPKTDAQVIQRMILATASKAYSRMKSIVDHSFEGISYGAKSQSYFLKKACEDIRKWVADNYPTETATLLTQFIGLAEPDFLAGAGIGLMISKGSIPSIPVAIEGTDALYGAQIVGTVSGSMPSIGQVMDALGALPGDQISIVTLNQNGSFAKSRFVINPEIDSTNRALEWTSANFTSAAFSEVSVEPLAALGYDGDIKKVDVSSPGSDNIATSIILSRKDGTKWLRSTQYLTSVGDELEVLMSENGPSVVIPIWLAGSTEIQNENPYYLNQAEQG